MKQLYYLIVSLLMVLTSCSQDDSLMTPTEYDRIETTNSTLQKSLLEVDLLFDKIYNGTRASRTISGIEGYSFEKNTRTTDDEYLIINYGINQGFAVIGNTENNSGIYAISDKGTLSIADTTECPALSYFFESLPNLSKPYEPLPKDTTIQDRPVLGITQDLSCELKPLLTPSVSAWGQGNPYNYYVCAETNGTYVGCIAVAVGQLMSFYEYPKSYKGYQFQWENIKSENGKNNARSNGLARLLREIGNSENLSVNTVDGSANITNVKRTFLNMGYTVNSDYVDYTSSNLMSFLKQKKKPVTMSGWNDNKKEGHSWVIDGFYYDCQTFSFGNEPVIYSGNGTLFHMVWGWNNIYNGYFKIDSNWKHYPSYDTDYDWDYWSDNDSPTPYNLHLRYFGDVNPK